MPTVAATGPLDLYDSTLDALAASSFPALSSAPLSAVLLAPNYVPDFALHSRFADIAAYEVPGGDSLRVLLTGTNVAGAAFFSDDLIFGDPVTVGPVRYLALTIGAPNGLSDDSLLIGVADLSPLGGALEAQCGRFSVAAPAGGWFKISRI